MKVLLLLALGACAAPARSQVETLPNGTRLHFVEQPSLPLVTIALFYAAGATQDAVDERGLSRLALRLVWNGHGELNEAQAEAALQEIGADVGADVHAEHTTVYVQCLAEHGRRGLELLHGAVTSPRFDPQVVQREVNQELAAVAQNKLQPAHLAQEAFVPALLGGHAYRGALTLANPDAIRGADPQTLRARAGAILQPQLCTAIIVGTKDEALLAAARGLLGKIPAAASPTEPASLPEPAPAAGGVHRVERPQMGQIYIRLGGLGLEFGDARRAACQVFERAFAGGFTSALVDELRVNRGLVYEAGLSQYWLRTRSPWSLITSTRAEKCGEVLQVVFDQLRAAQQGRLTESQVEAAKNMLLCDIAAGMQTQIGLAHAVWESLHWHGDAEAWRQHLAAIGKVTLADAVAAGRLYDLEQCTIVLVGEQEALQRVAVPKAGR